MNPLVISECVAGDGDLCGGVFLDEEFERAMKSNLGAEVWDAASPTELKDMAMDWEVGIKECIAGDPQAKFTIRLAGNTWRLSGGEIMRCFRIIKPKIKRLVKAQIDGIKAKKKLPKLVILVGGFGRCQYIRHFLTEDKGPCRAIRVMQNPDDASVSAIARGAVLAGIDGCKQADDIHAQGGTLIRARCSRFSYGWVFDDYFDPEKHSEEDKVFDEVRSRHMAQDQFAWVILKVNNKPDLSG